MNWIKHKYKGSPYMKGKPINNRTIRLEQRYAEPVLSFEVVSLFQI